MIEQGGSNDNFVADYYANIAKVKPGFPLPQHALKDGSTADKDDENVFHRKSKYEAGGVSAMSRKRGDKLGFLDRRNKDD